MTKNLNIDKRFNVGDVMHNLRMPTSTQPSSVPNHKPDSAALHLAAEKGDFEACMRLLSEVANVNQSSADGHTALHLAAKAGHSRVIELLIDHGADPTIQTHLGNTPLHGAAYTGNVGAVLTLLARGADPTLKNIKGQTAKDRAEECGRTEVVQVLSR